MPIVQRRVKLRTPQVRVLEVLAANGGMPMPRQTLKEKSRADISVMVGRQDDAERRALEASNGFPSLLGLDYVRLRSLDRDGVLVTAYEVTPAGLEALARHQREES